MKKRLTIPEPCHESWSKMQETGNQCRLCQSCEKEVIDFTQKSDREIAEKLNSTSNVCGRFTQSQINKEYTLPTKPNAIRKWTWASLLSGLLFSQTIKAQDEKVLEYYKPKHLDINLQSDFEVKLPPNAHTMGMMVSAEPPLGFFKIQHNTELLNQKVPHIISGIVTNEEGKPLPEVKITALSSQRTTTTDSEGRYTLLIPYGSQDTLSFEDLITGSFEEVAVESNEYTVNITLQEEIHLMGMSFSRESSPRRFSLKWFFSPISKFLDWFASLF